MDLRFSGEVREWRGPAPHHVVTVPESESAALESVSGRVGYGWGTIPVTAQIDGTTWTTSLWPEDGGDLVPPEPSVLRAERVDVGGTVTERLTVDV